jgi:hypothetical protein
MVLLTLKAGGTGTLISSRARRRLMGHAHLRQQRSQLSVGAMPRTVTGSPKLRCTRCRRSIASNRVTRWDEAARTISSHDRSIMVVRPSGALANEAGVTWDRPRPSPELARLGGVSGPRATWVVVVHGPGVGRPCDRLPGSSSCRLQAPTRRQLSAVTAAPPPAPERRSSSRCSAVVRRGLLSGLVPPAWARSMRTR